MTSQVAIGRNEEFAEGCRRVVRAEGRRIAIFRVDGELFALDDACPHMGASLADGRVDGRRVVCAWHGWSFDLVTGESGRRSGACARRHEIEIRDGIVFLSVAPEREPEKSAEQDWPVWDPDRHLRGPRGDEEENS